MYELLSIFGGTGAVLLALGGCVWKQLRTYHTSFEKEPSNLNKPTITLPNSWEHSHTETLAKILSPYGLRQTGRREKVAGLDPKRRRKRVPLP